MPVNTGLLGLGASHGNDLETVFMIPKRKGYLICESRVALFDMEETTCRARGVRNAKSPLDPRGLFQLMEEACGEALPLGELQVQVFVLLGGVLPGHVFGHVPLDDLVPMVTVGEVQRLGPVDGV